MLDAEKGDALAKAFVTAVDNYRERSPPPPSAWYFAEAPASAFFLPEEKLCF